MVRDEPELAVLEEHYLGCPECAEHTKEAADYVDGDSAVNRPSQRSSLIFGSLLLHPGWLLSLSADCCAIERVYAANGDGQIALYGIGAVPGAITALHGWKGVRKFDVDGVKTDLILH